MKITKRILKQIIKEELQNLKEGEMSQIVADEPPVEEPHEEEPHEDEMTAGEYYAKTHMGLAFNSAEADVLDLFSAEIRAARDELQKLSRRPKRQRMPPRSSSKDVLAFVQQVLGPDPSDEIIDV